MNNVRILPPEIVSKIAAGEVIERPASVIKELIENSLDAGADSISLELKSAGKNLIRIQDDGAGIPREDIETIFNRHATSKIASVDDLYDIHSLGFRGEALYSVAAVSDVVLASAFKEQDCGWETHVRGNQRLETKPCGRHRGTEIQVKELFFNTPARKKFLKSNTAELNAVLDTVIPYCLLFPEKRFSLENDGKAMINLAPAKSFPGRCAQALNLSSKDMLEETREFGDISLHLILGDINIQRGRKDLQFVFVNGRPVTNRTVSFHINEIYRLLLNPGVYPFFCVFITMPSTELDVNIHPSKREVKIKDDLRLVSLLRPFCEQLLMTKSKPRQSGPVFTIPAQGNPSAYAPLSADAPQVVADSPANYQRALDQSIALFKTERVEEKNGNLKDKLRQARYLGNLLKKYLLFETEDSLLLIDQHAAQERITFERLKNQMEKGSVEIQPLLAPVLVTLTPQELVIWEENKEAVGKAGFETTLFDKETLAVHSHPMLIENAEQSVRNLLAGEKLARLEPDKIARMACRSSVMFGFAMNPEQAEFQRKNLLLCADPFTCPHGRPTVVEIREDLLRKQFLRA